MWHNDLPTMEVDTKMAEDDLWLIVDSIEVQLQMVSKLTQFYMQESKERKERVATYMLTESWHEAIMGRLTQILGHIDRLKAKLPCRTY